MSDLLKLFSKDFVFALFFLFHSLPYVNLVGLSVLLSPSWGQTAPSGFLPSASPPQGNAVSRARAAERSAKRRRFRGGIVAEAIGKHVIFLLFFDFFFPFYTCYPLALRSFFYLALFSLHIIFFSLFFSKIHLGGHFQRRADPFSEILSPKEVPGNLGATSAVRISACGLGEGGAAARWAEGLLQEQECTWWCRRERGGSGRDGDGSRGRRCTKGDHM